MLPRGRPRALGAAALLLLLLLLLIGFFLFGGDLDCELSASWGWGVGRSPGSLFCSLMPRVPSDGRLRPLGAVALDRDPPADHGGHNRSDCVPPRPLPPKCEVGRCARPLAAGISGVPRPRPSHLDACGNPNTWSGLWR